MRRRLIALLPLAALVLGAPVAGAHPLTPSLLELREEPAARIVVSWKRPLTATDVLQPILPADCAPVASPVVRGDETARIVEVVVACREPLVGATVGVDGLAGSRADVLLRIVLRDGRVIHQVLRPAAPSFRVPEPLGALAISWSYVRLGAEHIAGGVDHLLFVLGLLVLAPSWRRLAGMITAFTTGHALTLSLAALGTTPLPAAPTEVLIALTILILADELVRAPRPDPPSLLQRHPAAITFGFGLLHGLGFAGALREAGLPPGEVVLALLGFNAGIESGQLAFVVVMIALARLTAMRWPTGRAGRTGVAYVLGTVAVCLVVERAAVMFGWAG